MIVCAYLIPMKKLQFEKIFIRILFSLILTSYSPMRIGINEYVFVYKIKSSSKTKHINVF